MTVLSRNPYPKAVTILLLPPPAYPGKTADDEARLAEDEAGMAADIGD
jgi:hypothetical protein